jgi:hypothetical protein
MAFETKMQLLLIGLLSLAYPLAIDNKKLNVKKKDDTLSFSEDDFNLNDWDEILDKSFD